MLKSLAVCGKMTILCAFVLSVSACNSGSANGSNQDSISGSGFSSAASFTKGAIIQTQVGQSLIVADSTGFIYDNDHALGGGIEPFPNNATTTSLVADDAGNIYAGTIAGESASVYVLKSSVWTQLATTLPNTQQQALSGISVAVDKNGDVYAEYSYESAVHLNSQAYELVAGSDSWTSLGSIPASDIKAEIAVDNAGNLYAGVVAHNYDSFVFSHESGANSWSLLGGSKVPHGSGGEVKLALDENNNVYVGTLSKNNRAYVYELESNSWTELGGGPVPQIAADISITSDINGDVYASVACINQSAYVYKSNGASWGNSLGGVIPKIATVSALRAVNGKLYLAIQNTNKAYVYELPVSGSQWQELGSSSVPNAENSPIGEAIITVDMHGNVYSTIGDNYVYKVYKNPYGMYYWCPAAGIPVPNGDVLPIQFITGDNNGNVYAVVNLTRQMYNSSTVYEFESGGLSWRQVGGSFLAKKTIHSMVLDNKGVPYISVTPFSDKGQDLYVYALESGTWIELGGGAVPTVGNQAPMAFDGDNTLYISTFNYVYKLESNVWQQVGSNLPISNMMGGIAIESGNVYIAISDWVTNSATYELESGATSWTKLGSDVPINDITTIAIVDGSVYIGGLEINNMKNYVYNLTSNNTWQKLGGSGILSNDELLSPVIISSSAKVYSASGDGSLYTIESGVWQNSYYGSNNGASITALALRPTN